jgi:hypothetical protein
MNNSEDEETNYKFFVEVERTADGYIETNNYGNRTQYFPRNYPDTITITNISLRYDVNLETGRLHPTIQGETCEAFRAIGTAVARKIYRVRLSSNDAPARSIIGMDYVVVQESGNSSDERLELILPEQAMQALASEVKTSKSARDLLVECKAGSFFVGHKGKERFTNDDPLLLPLWNEQHPVKEPPVKEPKCNDDWYIVQAEWKIDIEKVSIIPRSAREHHVTDVAARVLGNVGIHYVDEGASAKFHPMKDDISEVKNEIKAFRNEVASKLSQFTMLLLVIVIAALFYFFQHKTG